MPHRLPPSDAAWRPGGDRDPVLKVRPQEGPSDSAAAARTLRTRDPRLVSTHNLRLLTCGPTRPTTEPGGTLGKAQAEARSLLLTRKRGTRGQRWLPGPSCPSHTSRSRAGAALVRQEPQEPERPPRPAQAAELPRPATRKCHRRRERPRERPRGLQVRPRIAAGVCPWLPGAHAGGRRVRWWDAQRTRLSRGGSLSLRSEIHKNTVKGTASGDREPGADGLCPAGEEQPAARPSRSAGRSVPSRRNRPGARGRPGAGTRPRPVQRP